MGLEVEKVKQKLNNCKLQEVRTAAGKEENLSELLSNSSNKTLTPETKHEEFLQKVEEFVMKYASPKHEDLQLLFEPKSNDIKKQILNKENIELKEKLKILEEENFLLKQKLIKEEKF